MFMCRAFFITMAVSTLGAQLHPWRSAWYGSSLGARDGFNVSFAVPFLRSDERRDSEMLGTQLHTAPRKL